MTAMSKQSHQITMWKLVVVAVCLSVFLFGLQAKLAQYQQPSPSVTAVSSAKLWDGDHRMEVQNVLEITSLLVMAMLLLFQHLLLETSSLLPFESSPAPLRLSSLSHLERFFRPPPAR